MSLIDFILNLAGLLLWLNWRALPFDPLTKTTPATLVGTLRRAEPMRMKRWHFLAALGALILIRALFYCQLGPALNWTAGLNLIATKLPFQSDFFGRMLLYSGLSFGLMLGIFFLWLLLLSMLTRDTGENIFLARLVRLHLGRVDGWPWPVKLLLPLLAGAALWWLLGWALTSWGLMPRPVSAAQRAGQSALVGLSAYLAWKYLIAGLLALHWVNNYVYFGNHALWACVNTSARRLLSPLQKLPLHVGKMDFAPLVGIAVVFLLARLAESVLPELFQLWSR
ncbi:MAG: hypothetical protein MUF81_03790 [Verrucomicrobia bacterium]|jgi:uncharacterized protein YggT (Ycf19 family)|nr:hypothetical protein [Verrucomicrobiota bacterium]